MLPTYPAILKSNRIEWLADGPCPIPAERSLPVYVTLLEPPEAAAPSQGVRMATALERLAALSTRSDASDPVDWQKEVRQDRVLPGREE